MLRLYKSSNILYKQSNIFSNISICYLNNSNNTNNRYFASFSKNKLKNKSKSNNNINNSNNKNNKNDFFEQLEWSLENENENNNNKNNKKEDDFIDLLEWENEDQQIIDTTTTKNQAKLKKSTKTTNKQRQIQEVEINEDDEDEEYEDYYLEENEINSYNNNNTIKKEEIIIPDNKDSYGFISYSNLAIQNTIKKVHIDKVTNISNRIPISNIIAKSEYKKYKQDKKQKSKILKNKYKLPLTEKEIKLLFKEEEQEEGEEGSNNDKCLIEYIQTCNDRFSFIIKPNELKPYDIVFVFNKEYKYIDLGYIGENGVDYNSNNGGYFELVSNKSTNLKYSIDQIYGCFPFSLKRNNYELIYNEFLQSMLDMNLISTKQIKHLQSFKQQVKEYLDNSSSSSSGSATSETLHSIYCQLIKTIELFNTKTRKLPFFIEKENTFHSDYWRPTIKFSGSNSSGTNSSNSNSSSTINNIKNNKTIINGLNIIGEIEEWNNDLVLQNEIECTEAASVFFQNIRFKSPWADLMLFHTFLTVMVYRNHYSIVSRDYIKFTSLDQLYRMAEISTLMHNSEQSRLIFNKYCLNYLINKLDNSSGTTASSTSFKIPIESKNKLLLNESIPLLSNEEFNQDMKSNNNSTKCIPNEFFTIYKPIYIELIQHFNQTTDYRYLNGFNEKIHNYFLKEIGATTPYLVQLLANDCFKKDRYKKFKTLTEWKLSKENSIHIYETPFMNFKDFNNNNNSNSNSEKNNEKRKLINKSSFSFIDDDNNIESSIGIDDNNSSNNYSIFINIPDFTDSIEPFSSLDNWCMLRSSTITLPNKKYPMLPLNILESIQFNNNSNSNSNSTTTTTTTTTTKNCISLLITIDPMGNIINYDVIQSKVKNVKVDTFKNYQKIIDNNNNNNNNKEAIPSSSKSKEDESNKSDLLKLLKVSKLLKRNRQLNGFDSQPDSTIHSNILYKQSPSLIPTSSDNSNNNNYNYIELDTFSNKLESSRIIYQEFKYLTNHLIAKYANDNNITIPLIISEKNRNEILNNSNCSDSNSNSNSNKEIESLIKSYQYDRLSNYEKIIITTDNILQEQSSSSLLQHQTTGYNLYTNVFSPLNNYLDLFVLREIKEFKKKKLSTFNDEIYKQELTLNIIPYLNNNLKSIKSIKNQILQEWFQFYLNQLHFIKESSSSQSSQSLSSQSSPLDSAIMLPKSNENINTNTSDFILLENGFQVTTSSSSSSLNNNNNSNQIFKLKKPIHKFYRISK